MLAVRPTRPLPYYFLATPNFVKPLVSPSKYPSLHPHPPPSSSLFVPPFSFRSTRTLTDFPHCFLLNFLFFLKRHLKERGCEFILHVLAPFFCYSSNLFLRWPGPFHFLELGDSLLTHFSFCVKTASCSWLFPLPFLYS